MTDFPIFGKPYYVSYDNGTDLEPRPGWYFSIEHEDNEDIIGPFNSINDAKDVIENFQDEGDLNGRTSNG